VRRFEIDGWMIEKGRRKRSEKGLGLYASDFFQSIDAVGTARPRKDQISSLAQGESR
jgi:hypothetical protein